MFMTSCTSSKISNQPGQAGFTLVEIIVTMAIMVMLATATYLSIHSLSADQSITNAQNVVRAALVLARNNANTGHKCCSTDTVPSGYGVYWTNGGTEFSMYADLDGSNDYNSGDEIISTSNLESSVDFMNCDGTATASTGTCDVLFTAGNSSSIYLNGTPLSANATIVVDYSPTPTDIGQITVYYPTAVIE